MKALKSSQCVKEGVLLMMVKLTRNASAISWSVLKLVKRVINFLSSSGNCAVYHLSSEYFH